MSSLAHTCLLTQTMIHIPDHVPVLKFISCEFANVHIKATLCLLIELCLKTYLILKRC